MAGFDAYACFQSVDPAKNRYRFYHLAWQAALWGGEALVKSWGRVGAQGRTRSVFYPDRQSAREQIVAAIKQRLRRGYQVVEWG